MNSEFYIIALFVAFVLGVLCSFGSIAGHIRLQRKIAESASQYQQIGQKIFAESQAKLNESFLPLKKEETTQLHIQYDAERMRMQHQEKMGDGL